MSGWALEEESLDAVAAVSGVRASSSRAKGVFFAEQDDSSVREKPGSRRQQRGSKEVVLQSDDEDDKDPVDMQAPPVSKPLATVKADSTALDFSSKVKTAGKQDELSGADVVASAERQSALSEKTTRAKSLMETDMYVHHLVCDFLGSQGHDKVLKMLEEEKVGLLDRCLEWENLTLVLVFVPFSP